MAGGKEEDKGKRGGEVTDDLSFSLPPSNSAYKRLGGWALHGSTQRVSEREKRVTMKAYGSSREKKK